MSPATARSLPPELEQALDALDARARARRLTGRVAAVVFLDYRDGTRRVAEVLEFTAGERIPLTPVPVR